MVYKKEQLMKNFFYKTKVVFIVFVSLILLVPSYSFSKGAPDSFADLADKLMPSVVNIAATRVVEARTQ